MNSHCDRTYYTTNTDFDYLNMVDYEINNQVITVIRLVWIIEKMLSGLYIFN